MRIGKCWVRGKDCGLAFLYDLLNMRIAPAERNARLEHTKKYTVYAEVLNCQLRFIFSLIKSAETVGSHVSLKELELFLQENIKNEANKTFFF